MNEKRRFDRPARGNRPERSRDAAPSSAAHLWMFTFSFSRKWTDQDMMEYLSKQSISPSYSQLQSKMKDYEGRIMAYRSYIVDIGESGDEYIIKMALNRKNGKYSNMILVTADELPSFEAGERVMMYGTCEGMSLSTGAEGEEEDESYPCFALLLFATLEN